MKRGNFYEDDEPTADVVAVIKLRDNGQTLTVEWRHVRAALRGDTHG